MTDFGAISSDGPHAAVRFERWYAALPMDLWDALTSPARMRRWLGAEVSIEARSGGAVRLRWQGTDEMHGVITAFEPGRLLEYTWNEAALGVKSLVRFELRPEGAGTVLILAHTRVPADQAAGFGAGWHGHLDALALALAGRPADPHERYRELLPQYADRAGTAGTT
jgi:uncharacterized protein YndB with AHSA1/START domain